MFNYFMKKTHMFIVEEKDVTTVLAVINKHRRYYDTRVGNCGWAEEPNKWFIGFDMRDKYYGEVVRDLNEIGNFKLDVRPAGQVDLIFNKD